MYSVRSGAFLLAQTECSVEKEFLFDRNRFQLVRTYFDHIHANPLFSETGDLAFHDRHVLTKQTENKYFFGPYIYHDSIEYGPQAANLNFALRRLTATREPSVPRLHRQLQYFQRHIVHSRTAISIRNQLRDSISRHFINLPNMFDNFIEYACKAHPKRSLRIRALAEIFSKNMYMKERWIQIVTGKVKLFEFAKPGKYPRLINDLTVIGSLVGGWLVEELKHVMSDHPINIGGSTARFISSPKHPDLIRGFKEIADSYDNNVHMIYFSDDSCLSYFDGEKRVMANMDISSCDGSHTAPLFNYLLSLTSHIPVLAPVMEKLVDQLRLPLTLRHKYDRTQQVTLQSNSPTLFSGSVLTTITNNLANLMIFTSIIEHTHLPIQTAAQRAGYLTTLENCTLIEKLQFLKHSPFHTNDGMHVFLNLGVLLRGIGVARVVLDRSSIVKTKLNAHNYMFELLSCFKYSGVNSIFKTLRLKYPQRVKRAAKITRDSVDSHFINSLNGDRVFDVPDDVIARRYGVTVEQIEHFNHVLKNAQYNDGIHHCVSHAILSLDYGAFNGLYEWRRT